MIPRGAGKPSRVNLRPIQDPLHLRSKELFINRKPQNTYTGKDNLRNGVGNSGNFENRRYKGKFEQRKKESILISSSRRDRCDVKRGAKRAGRCA